MIPTIQIRRSKIELKMFIKLLSNRPFINSVKNFYINIVLDQKLKHGVVYFSKFCIIKSCHIVVMLSFFDLLFKIGVLFPIENYVKEERPKFPATIY